MVGPRAPCTTVAPRSRMAAVATSITPPSSPRHPAWTAANTPSSLPSAIDAQSAVSMASPAEGDAAVDDDHRTRSVLEGDGMVSASPSAGLAILTADCASIALGSEEGEIAAEQSGR